MDSNDSAEDSQMLDTKSGRVETLDALIACQDLDLLDSFASKFALYLKKYIFDDLVAGKISIPSRNESGTRNESTISNELKLQFVDEKTSVLERFNAVLYIFQHVQTRLQSFSTPDLEASLKRFFLTLGSTLWPDIANQLMLHLTSDLPSTLEGVEEFKKEVGDPCCAIESSLNQIGISDTTNDLVIHTFFSNIIDAVALKRAMHHLEKGMTFIRSLNYETVEVGERQPVAPFFFPTCHVHQTTVDVVHLLEDIQMEIVNAVEYPSM